MKGIVVFMLSNVGSKSEGVFPFLYLKNGEFLRIWLYDDYSVFGDKLKEFDAKYVSIEGETNENGTFVISSIEVIDSYEEPFCENDLN